MNKFINVWQKELIAQTKLILRTHSLFKNDFFTEHHLELITDFRYRAVITKLRCSSHALEIERGRYQNPKVPRDLRLCLTCKVVEDENHFVTKCSINQAERRHLYISCKAPHFSTLSDDEKFVYPLTNNDPQILTWFGKFVHHSFIVRNNIVLSWATVMGTSTVWSYVLMLLYWYRFYVVLISFYWHCLHKCMLRFMLFCCYIYVYICVFYAYVDAKMFNH